MKNEDITKDQFMNDELGIGKTITYLKLIRQRTRYLTKLDKIFGYLEEELKLKTQILDSSVYSIFLHDFEGKIIYVNETAYKSLGYTKGQLMGMNFYDLEAVNASEPSNFMSSKIRELIENREILFRSALFQKDGSIMPVQVHAKITESDNKKFILSVVQGIKEKEEVKEEGEVKLPPKIADKVEIEVQKRSMDMIKNNLQIISSLINLQSVNVKDKKVIQLFRESQNRLQAMATAYNNLYHSSEIGKFDFAEYIQKLASEILSSYRVDPKQIKLKMDLENVMLDIDTAVPCGIIINELLTNSIKHGFPEGKKGDINIKLVPEDSEKITLTMSDNGVGFPEDLDFKNVRTLGLRLVKNLTNQIKGKIEYKGIDGTSFKITFPESV